MSADNLSFLRIKEEISGEAERLRQIQPPLPEFKMPIIYCNLLKPSGKEFIEELYKKILDRAPSEKEITEYLGAIEQGKASKEYVLQSVALSDEAIAKGTEVKAIRAKEFYGQLLLKFDGDLFVKNAYKWLLGREPEPEAVVDNVDRIRSGVSKADILRSIGGSIECSNRGTRLVGLDEAAAGNGAAPPASGIMVKIKRALIKLKRLFG